MYRGTTPTLYFKINNLKDITTLAEVNISFKSPNSMLLTKTISDVIIDTKKNILSLDLTQEETLKFKEPEVLVQIKFMFNDGKVCASNIYKIPVESPLNTTIMEITPSSI